jgi:putative cell wall-binding protein
MMKSVKSVISVVCLCLSSSLALAADKPNVVIVFMDNFGWGEMAVALFVALLRRDSTRLPRKGCA